MPNMVSDIEDLRAMLNEVSNEVYNEEKINLQIKLYEQIEKRQKLQLHLLALMAKHGDKLKGLKETGLIGEGNEKTGKFECRNQKGIIITKKECNNYASDIYHFEACTSCEHYPLTETSTQVFLKLKKESKKGT